jgi:hypothetical protein
MLKIDNFNYQANWSGTNLSVKNFLVGTSDYYSFGNGISIEYWRYQGNSGYWSISFSEAIAGGQTISFSDNKMDDNEFHEVKIQKQGSKMTMIIDGNNIGTRDMNRSGSALHYDQINIGTPYNGWTWDGKMDNLSFSSP